MHELGIAQDIVKIAHEYAAKNNAQRITAFNLELSAAAHESEDALRFHLDHLTRGTLAEHARVEIKRVPVTAHCLDCGNEFAWEEPDEMCPRCNSAHLRAAHVDEFRLASIDIE
ncbi:MAG: hydrogenase maturation nickel metallochaperone HypA [Chloroflexi bacterium]|nr:hydrogenase maturation nickel metallochaperone HypA [Chloroflexota bacterium]